MRETVRIRGLLKVVLFIVGILSYQYGIAESCISTGNGTWNSTTTWLCGGVVGVPDCEDTVYVQSGHTVSVSSQNDYSSCGSILVIDVSGTLQFTGGSKLELPCGSLVSIQTGGLVKKATAGGGTSTLISICASNVWIADDGKISGPLAWGGWVLPIELFSFLAFREDKSVNIEWVTLSESNNDFFEIERMLEAGEFEPLAAIKGAGHSKEEIDYEWVDQNAPSSLAYYRLKQTDFDGKFEYSEVAPVYPLSPVDQYQAMLVPGANGNLNVLDFENKSIDAILVYSITGALVKEIRPYSSHTSIPIDFNESGLYLISILFSTGEIENHKTIVTKS
jgi:hypothetical protein